MIGAKVSWDEVALVARKKGYVLCRSDEGFSLVRDDGTSDGAGTGDEVAQDGGRATGRH